MLDFQADAAKKTNICGVEQLSSLFNQIQRKINSNRVERVSTHCRNTNACTPWLNEKVLNLHIIIP